MLVFTRRRDESFVIGDDVKVTVLGIRGSSVSLGISAPSDTVVVRSELLGKSKKELATNRKGRDNGES